MSEALREGGSKAHLDPEAPSAKGASSTQTLTFQGHVSHRLGWPLELLLTRTTGNTRPLT